MVAEDVEFGCNATLLQTGVETFDVVSYSPDSVHKASSPELCDLSSVPAFSCAQW